MSENHMLPLSSDGIYRAMIASALARRFACMFLKEAAKGSDAFIAEIVCDLSHLCILIGKHILGSRHPLSYNHIDRCNPELV
jgi:hypothetical protein